MDNRKKAKAHSQSNEHVLRLMAGGNGKGTGGGGPQLAQTPAPPRGPTLTEQFNAAARKPVGPAQTPGQKKIIQELKEQIESITGQSKKGQDKQAGKRRVSQHDIDALKKLLSQPRSTPELTPLGSVNNACDPQRDRAILKEIKRQQRVLKQHKGRAKKAFDKASGNGPSMGM